MNARLTRGAGLLLLSALLLPGCAGRGRELFVSEGCVNCHRFRDLGGGGAPDLTDVSSRREAASLRTQIVASLLQDNFLFNRSVRQNLRLARPEG